ncbi:MAG TPA: hypothetical protein VD926_09260, partial [Acidimicrobiales bacterium]|nr:hypothetical protein [Acidimicrobiales bacterium]
MNLVLAQAEAAPAGGTAVEEVVVASIVALIAVVGVIALGVAHRRRGVLDPLARVVEEKTGMPAWSALPVAITSVTLLCAVVGYYWDVSWHIDRGRDAGAFANPAHWLIIIGLDGIAFAGILSLILGDRKTATSVEIRPGWHVPVGGLMLTVCGVIALAGFPSDDVWHRLFGQDVTAWGPTHIQMIGGASLATLAAWSLGIEGMRSAGPGWLTTTRKGAYVRWFRDVLAGGALLIGLSTLQIEFDFGVPQFRQLFHPIMIALAASIALVAVRIRAGKAAALGAVLFFLGLHALLSFVITEPFGRSTMHFPLYLVEAVVVEVVALIVPRTRQLTFGALAGLAVGTIGFGAEWLWTQVWMPIPWGTPLLPEALVLVPIAGVAGGLLGGFVGRAVAPLSIERQATPRGVALAAWAGAVGCLAIALPMQAHTDWEAVVTLEETAPGQAIVTAELQSPAAVEGAEDANWFEVISWQGASDTEDGGLVVADLEEVDEGVYRSNRAVPIDGTAKTMIRLHTGTTLQAIPIYLPDDPAIPAEGYLVESGSAVEFVRDKSVLQREARTDNVWLERGAYVVMLLLATAWLAVISWGLRRIDPTGRVAPLTGDSGEGAGADGVGI